MASKSRGDNVANKAVVVKKSKKKVESRSKIGSKREASKKATASTATVSTRSAKIAKADKKATSIQATKKKAAVSDRKSSSVIAKSPKGASVSGRRIKANSAATGKVAKVKTTEMVKIESVDDTGAAPARKSNLAAKKAKVAADGFVTPKSAKMPVKKGSGSAKSSGRRAALGELAQKWASLQRRAKKPPVPYRMTETYEAKTAINHKVLGWGYILSNINDRLEVLFEDGVKTLISNYKR